MLQSAFVLGVIAVAALVYAVSRGGLRAAWPGVVAVIASATAVVSIMLALPVQPVRASQNPASQCEYRNGLNVCEPFKSVWLRLETIYGDPLTTAMQIDGRLTQYFTNGGLHYTPENAPEYQVQGVLLGSWYLRNVIGQEPVDMHGLASSDLLNRWVADRGRNGLDVLQILGQPLWSGNDGNGRHVVVYQRIAMSAPDSATALTDVRIEPIGDHFIRVPDAQAIPWYSQGWATVAVLSISSMLTLFALYYAIFRATASGDA